MVDIIPKMGTSWDIERKKPPIYVNRWFVALGLPHQAPTKKTEQVQLALRIGIGCSMFLLPPISVALAALVSGKWRHP